MKRVGVGGLVGVTLLVSASSGWAEMGHEHGSHDHGADDHGASAAEQQATTASSQEQTLTGEVVDVFCYLSHPAEGLGPKHAGCAKKCIKSGLPVAIKVSNQLYLATMSDHHPANQQLAELAGRQVTVRGNVMEKDGQHLISITSVEPTN